jgi:pimeloyl-ACP methyl ester carboxylesterase
VNLWGGSYGTRAGLVYARRHPDRLRSVTLDGAAPFEVRIPLHNAENAQRAFDALVRDCRADVDCRTRFPRLREALATVLDRLARAPVKAAIADPRTAERIEVTVTRALFASGVRVGLYTPVHASAAPFIIYEALEGRFEAFAALLVESAAWSTDTMSFGVTLSVLCSEDVPRIADEDVARLTAGFLGRSEVDAWRAWCSAWPEGAAPAEARQTDPIPIPALVLSGDLDPVTPPAWGRVLADHFEPSRDLVAKGAAHNVSFSGCAPDLIAQFVERASADDLDASCLDAIARPPFLLTPRGPRP